jgi:large subunit ribosomal protein L22
VDFICPPAPDGTGRTELEDSSRDNEEMEVRARLSFGRVAPRKARLVADLIRGKKSEEALNILTFTKKGAAKILTKLLKSAIANATQKKTIDIDRLYVKKVTVDQGPMMKRFTPRALGRATMIQKRTSHITIVLDEA